MRALTAMSITLLLAGLTACGGEQEPNKVEGVIPAHQLQALEKAKNVEDMLKEADKARREATDE
jgi:hypothetical protein